MKTCNEMRWLCRTVAELQTNTSVRTPRHEGTGSAGIFSLTS